jgi:hypothetical protein
LVDYAVFVATGGTCRTEYVGGGIGDESDFGRGRENVTKKRIGTYGIGTYGIAMFDVNTVMGKRVRDGERNSNGSTSAELEDLDVVVSTD